MPTSEIKASVTSRFCLVGWFPSFFGVETNFGAYSKRGLVLWPFFFVRKVTPRWQCLKAASRLLEALPKLVGKMYPKDTCILFVCYWGNFQLLIGNPEGRGKLSARHNAWSHQPADYTLQAGVLRLWARHLHNHGMPTSRKKTLHIYTYTIIYIHICVMYAGFVEEIPTFRWISRSQVSCLHFQVWLGCRFGSNAEQPAVAKMRQGVVKWTLFGTFSLKKSNGFRVWRGDPICSLPITLAE